MIHCSGGASIEEPHFQQACPGREVDAESKEVCQEVGVSGWQDVA